jgi:hypothetical protein
MPVCASTTEVEEVLGFAQSLQIEGEYYRAITEYKRVLFLTPPESTATRGVAILGLGGALFAGMEYSLSAEWLHAHVEELPGGARRTDGLNLMYRGFLADGAGDRLLQVTHELGDSTPEVRLYQGLAHARMGNWRVARSVFQELGDDPRCGCTATAYCSIADEAARAHWKNPAVARGLALVPGLGYWYAGYKQTAWASLLVNAVFIGATIQAFRSDQEILGGFLGFFTLSWYAGNVYGSAVAARRHNVALQNGLWNRLEY